MLAAGLSLLAAGCTWVSPADVLDKVDLLDDDEDGTPNGEDCAPNDPRQGGAGVTELAYDGLDNDCALGDELDQDGDGWPGVDRAAWEALVDELGSGLSWPSALSDVQVDCDDLDGEVFPGAAEVPYDGHHTDCDTVNDFDLDLDGFVATDWASTPAYADYLLVHPEAAGLPGGDCNDREDDVHPGAPDLPYDGVDADCAYDNDFDADGDGWIVTDPTGATDYWAAFTAYSSRPGYGHLTAAEGDCLDQPRAVEGARAFEGPTACEGSEFLVDDAGVVEASLVHPDACDLRYDGIDADCNGDNDYDYDGDGFSDLNYLDELQTYLDAWGYVGQVDLALATDCNDRNAGVNPLALEVLGDGRDQDCFAGGGVGVCRFGAFGDCVARPHSSALVWTGAGRPSLAGQPEAYVLSLYAEAASLPGTSFSVQEPSWFSHSLDRTEPTLTARWDAAGPSWWRPPGGALSDRLASFAEDDTLWVASTLTAWPATASLLLAPLAWNGSTSPPYAWLQASQLSTPTSATAAPYADVDAWTDPGTDRRWVVTCRPDELVVMTLPPSDPTQPRKTTLAAGGSSCALVQDGAGLSLAVCGEDGCTGYRLTAVGTNTPLVTFTSNLPWQGEDWVEVRSHRAFDLDNAVTLFLDGEGGAAYLISSLSPAAPRQPQTPDGPWPILLDWDVQKADIVVYDGSIFVPFLGSDGTRTDLFLGILQPENNRESIVSFGLPEVLGGATPVEVSAFVDDERLVLAVVSTTGAQDVVTWASYAH
jgi:hypothetical protein